MIWELIASLVVACVNAYFTLDKADREFYRENRRIIDLKRTLTEEETDTINVWLGRNANKSS